MAVENNAQQDALSPFTSLYPYQFALLRTFRKSGVAVPTPIWFAHDQQGRLYFMTVSNTGKVKRIRNNGHVTLTPCTRSGQIVGDGKEIEGQARELPASEFARASDLLARKYGFMYKAFMFVGNIRKLTRTYIEIVPEISPK